MQNEGPGGSHESGSRGLDGGERANSSVLIGVSPDTSRPFFALAADSGRALRFHDAAMVAERESEIGSFPGLRVPTRSELTLLFLQRALVPGLHTTILSSNAIYWASEKFGDDGEYAWAMRIDNGGGDWIPLHATASLRLVHD